MACSARRLAASTACAWQEGEHGGPFAHRIGQVPHHERCRLRPPAQGRPDPGRQLGRREGLDDVVGGAGVQGPGNGLVPAIGGDEDDRQIRQLGDAFHQLDAVRLRQQRVEQDQLGLLRLEEVGQLPRVAGHERGVAGRGESVPNVPKRLRVVVHDNDSRLRPSPGRGRGWRQTPPRPRSRRRPGSRGLSGRRGGSGRCARESSYSGGSVNRRVGRPVREVELRRVGRGYPPSPEALGDPMAKVGASQGLFVELL